MIHYVVTMMLKRVGPCETRVYRVKNLRHLKRELKRVEERFSAGDILGWFFIRTTETCWKLTAEDLRVNCTENP